MEARPTAAKAAKAASRELLTAGLVVQEGLAAQTQAREDKADRRKWWWTCWKLIGGGGKMQVAVD